MSAQRPHYVWDVKRQPDKEDGRWMYHVLLFDGTALLLEGYMDLQGLERVMANPEDYHRAHELFAA